MRVLCYQTWADEATKEQLWQYADAFGAGPVVGCNCFYFREDRLMFALLLDHTMTPVPNMDYYL
jgi:hypothetical protein